MFRTGAMTMAQGSRLLRQLLVLSPSQGTELSVSMSMSMPNAPLQCQLASLLMSPSAFPHQTQQVRYKFKDIDLPQPGKGNYFRRTVHYPKEYTIKPIKYTNMAGRDPIYGRVVVGTLGGGIKWPYLWVDYKRTRPPGSPPLIERVVEIIEEPNRTAYIALVGSGDKLRYVIATENMKRGDIITTSSELTRHAVRAKEGDAHPVGSLPLGTTVCCVEFIPGEGGYFARGAGTCCTILRKIGQRIIVQIPSKREISIDPTCMAVVGRVSNIIHNTIPIGSPNRLRHLGYRPRSGLWHRKTGYHGRKIRPIPPMMDFSHPLPEKLPEYRLTLQDYPYHYPKNSEVDWHIKERY